MVLKTLANTFIGKTKDEQRDIMRDLMLKYGFKETVAPGPEEKKTIWFSRDDVDVVCAFAWSRDGVYLPVMMPKDFSEAKYMKKGIYKRTIYLHHHGNKDSAITVRFSSIGLHRVLYNFYGIAIPDNLEVDHISLHEGICILKELRLCTSEENKLNKKNTRKKSNTEFDYDKYHDFRDSFWIPFLHYVLGIISYDEMHTLRAMELGEI